MPLEGFICPDGIEVKLESCYKECRLGHRCLTLPSLVSISKVRDWTGEGSTTQLLLGTMEAYLKLTKPYYVVPEDRAFMLDGTEHHRNLEEVARELGLVAEVPLSLDKDVFDLLEWEGKELVLTDYKRWGSFRVAKALGIVVVGKHPDPSGAVYKTTSKYGKAGEPKLVPVFGVNPDKIDNFEAKYQLNRYRIMLKTLASITVHRLQLQATVRDGGLYVAKERGVFHKIYLIPIPILPDDEVEGYFAHKQEALKLAMEQDHWELPCNVRESWEGMKCAEYCDVWEFCGKGKLVHGIGG